MLSTITSASAAVTVGSMTTLVPIMGGYFLLLLFPAVVAQLHQGSFFQKKEVEEVLVLWKKS